MDLGTRLRTVREKVGLSQRELAKRAGVTNGTISLIEQNRVSPSVSSLKKVLDGLPMSLAEFFTYELADNPPQVFYHPQELPNVGSGNIGLYLVGSAAKNRTLTMLREIYPPQSDTGKEMLCHEGQECGVVVRGTIEITVNQETRVLQAGDAYYFDSTQPHRFRNVGHEECEVVSANTPPTI